MISKNRADLPAKSVEDTNVLCTTDLLQVVYRARSSPVGPRAYRLGNAMVFWCGKAPSGDGG